MKKLLLLSLFAITLIAFSCKVDDSDFEYYYYTPAEYKLLSEYLNLPVIPADYKVSLPNYLLFTGGGFPREVESAKVELGRVLFYDKNLSKDGTISCGSCHKQALAFSDNASVSKGVFDRSGERNSIALSSVPSFGGAYDNTGSLLFWDNRARDVQEQSRASLENVKEMDMNMSEVVAAVSQQPYYSILFKKAYGDQTVSEGRVTESIQSFVHSLASFKSKFDVAAEAVFNPSQPNSTFPEPDFSLLSSQENLGKQIYLNNCSTCHTRTFTIPTMQQASNGLDEYPTDLGVGGISQFLSENGTFKIPALRNVALTAPYMHDGRFQTLEEVVEHYSTGIKPHANLHPELKNPDGSPKHFNFSNEEKQALVAFLQTLTDSELLTDVRYADPFK